MKRILKTTALLFCFSAGAAQADLRNFVAVCGDANASARDVVSM